MTNRKGGPRRKTRHKMAKPTGTKGKISISRYLQEFKEGERVKLNIESSIHKGMFNPKYQGRTGIIIRKRGNCYEVNVKDITKLKKLIIHPVHLTR